MTEMDWAGVRCLSVHHHDLRRMGGAGLFGFVRLGPGPRALLYVDQADCIREAVAAAGRPWREALALGMDAACICPMGARTDRLILKAWLIRRLAPPLNPAATEPAQDRERLARLFG
jgi:hypothetical protein